MAATKCVSCSSGKTRSRGRELAASINLDIPSFDLIWSIFTRGIYNNVNCKCNSQIFDTLAPFARLTYQEISTTYYQLYLATKPIHERDPNYRLAQQKSTSMLISLLWSEISRFSDIPVKNSVAADRFGQVAIQKGMGKLETDAQLLFDPNSNQTIIDRLVASYGLQYHEQSISIPNSPETAISRPKVLEHLYQIFQGYTYHWPWIKSIKDLYQVIEPQFKACYPQINLSLVPTSGVVETNEIFNRVLTSQKLVPNPHLAGYRLTAKFQDQIRKWLLAEAILRNLSWDILRVFCLDHHTVLVQTLSLTQLKVIYQAVSLCDIIMVKDKDKTWETLISDIGDVLVSRALQEVGRRPGRTRSPSISALGQVVDVDSERDIIRRWFQSDRDYALVALCNVLQSDGRVAVAKLQLQITSRIRSLGLAAANDPVIPYRAKRPGYQSLADLYHSGVTGFPPTALDQYS